MKVISMLQPWATLAVIGAKKVETRSFNTSFRGELLIHASLGRYYGKDPKVSCRELCYQLPFNRFINNGAGFDKLPFGAIIGKVNLVETMMFGSDRSIEYFGQMDKAEAKQEFAFGDFTEGRYGWLFTEPVLFEKPIYCKGSLSLWDYEMNKTV